MEIIQKFNSFKNGILKSLIFILVNTMVILPILTPVEAQTYTEQLKEQLMLVIPEVTENPSHTITFKDPGGGGVTLEIDGQGEKTIESPYELPTLGIGEHTLIFKFLDEQEVKQTLEEEIVIIPRPPELNTPEILKSKLNLNGEGVAGGKIELFLSDGDIEIREEVEINNTGDWEYSTLEELNSGDYTVIAIARKNGYASKYSEPKMFTITGEVRGIEDHIANIKKNTTVKLEDINPEEIPYILESNPTLAAALGLPLLIGILLGILVKAILGGGGSKKVEDLLKSNFEGGKADKLSRKNKKKLVHKLQEKLAESESKKKTKSKPQETNIKKSSKKHTETPKNKKSSEQESTEKKEKSKIEKKDSIKKTDKTTEPNNDDPQEKSTEKEKQKVKTLESNNDATQEDTKETTQIDPKNKESSEQESTENKATKEEFPEKMEDFEKKTKKDETSNNKEATKKKKKGGVLSKSEFLKKFKIFDPDDEDGKEKKEKKKNSRNIKINLGGKKKRRRVITRL